MLRKQLLLEQLFLEQLLLEHNLGPKSHKSKQEVEGPKSPLAGLLSACIVQYLSISLSSRRFKRYCTIMEISYPWQLYYK